MAEVRIRHCRVVVRRHGGWSWGPDPRAFANALVAALPRLLERRLGTLWRDGDDVWITAPVHIRIPANWRDLVPQRGHRGSQQAWERAAETALAPHIERTLAAVFGKPEHERNAGQKQSPEPSASIGPAAAEFDGSEFGLMLAGWLEAGLLGFVLERLPRAALECWHRRLTRLHAPATTRDPDGHAPAGPEELVRQEWQQVREALGPYPAPAPARMRYELAFAAEVARKRRVGVEHPMVQQALMELRQAAEKAVPPQLGDPAETAMEAAVSGAHDGLAEPPRARAARALAAVRTGDVRFASALPWLALAVLTRAGVARAAGGIFEAERLEDLLPLFGAALGRKLYPASGRSWKHAEEANRAVAAFGGIDVPGLDRLAGLPRAAHRALPALWLAYHAAVRAGRNAAAPMALLGEDKRRFWLLMDEQEGYPLGCATELEALAPSLALYPASPVWFAPGALRNVEADLLARAGATLIPDLPAEREEGLAAVWRLFEERQAAIPRADAPDMEHLLTALACLALASLGARLPQTGRPADPAEIFEAFADMDALAEFRGERIRIRLPLGQRYFVLEKAGLLRQFAGAAWLAGRTVEFARG